MEEFSVCNNAIVKIASRCNLNCTYCYMYNLGDDTWKRQPKFMSASTVVYLGQRIKEHCVKYKKDYFNIIFHGGEPLLATKDFFVQFIQKINQIVKPSGININYVLQTNGTLLSEAWCKLFDELNIVVGISIDGLKEDNDLHRIYHSGKGSYDDIIKGLKVLQNSAHYKHKPGVLSVINISADSVKTYQHFKSLGVNNMDFLFPDANHATPPFRGNYDSETAYADWLIPMFDVWFDEKSSSKIVIRIFRQIMQLILGDKVTFEIIGSEYNDAIVVDTDGSLEATDTLRICGNGFTKEGSNVSSHSFDQALETPLARMYINAHKMLSDQCTLCPINQVCGGGSIQNRYSAENGFNNPSVYCKDLIKLITHIQNRIVNALPDGFRHEMDIMTYDDVLQILDENQALAVKNEHRMFLASF
jgi:uncharacterized protein